MINKQQVKYSISNEHKIGKKKLNKIHRLQVAILYPFLNEKTSKAYNFLMEKKDKNSNLIILKKFFKCFVIYSHYHHTNKIFKKNSSSKMHNI